MGKVVYFFGDSFVAGFGDPTGRGWVGRVQAGAHEPDAFTAVNRGVPGATSPQVAADWLDALERLALAGLGAEDAGASAGHPPRVVFSFGTNDVISGVDRAESLAALVTALDVAAGAGMPSFVVGPPPVGDLPEADTRLAALSDEFAELCAERGVRFVATHRQLTAAPAWQSEIRSGDGSHPQAAGYTELADLVISGGFYDWLCET